MHLEERFQTDDGDCIGGEEDKPNWAYDFLEKSVRFDKVFVVVEGWETKIILRFLAFELEVMVS